MTVAKNQETLMIQRVADPRVQRVLGIVCLTIVAVLILAGCSSETESPAASVPDAAGTADTEVPTVEATTEVVASDEAEPSSEVTPVVTTEATDESAPASAATAEPTQVVELAATETPESESTDMAVIFPTVAPITIVIPEGCAPGSSTDVQKAKLIEIGSAMFPGTTNKERRRLQFAPEARDHRQGGLWLVVEFNGDELESVVMKKAALDDQMRDAYDALFNSGCDELVQVDLTGIHEAVTTREVGNSVVTPVVVFKTRLTLDVAEGVDWANKQDLNFNEIWNQLLINPRWRKELREAEAAP